MAQTNPNPVTNPGMELRCNNCDHMVPDPSSGLTPGPTFWQWNTPHGTYVGGPEEFDATRALEINVMHPHCPKCSSHSVTVVRTL